MINILIFVCSIGITLFAFALSVVCLDFKPFKAIIILSFCIGSCFFFPSMLGIGTLETHSEIIEITEIYRLDYAAKYFKLVMSTNSTLLDNNYLEVRSSDSEQSDVMRDIQIYLLTHNNTNFHLLLKWEQCIFWPWELVHINFIKE